MYSVAWKRWKSIHLESLNEFEIDFTLTKLNECELFFVASFNPYIAHIAYILIRLLII